MGRAFMMGLRSSVVSSTLSEVVVSATARPPLAEMRVVAAMVELVLKAPVAAVLPTKNWAKSAVVALRVLAAAIVTSRSRLMPPSAKLASSAPSSLRRSSGVSTKLVAVRLLTVKSAVGATPPLFSKVVRRLSMEVTVEPRLLKVATRGYRESDWPLLQQSQEICRVDPFPSMGCADRRLWHRRFADDLRRELCLDQVVDPAAFGAGRHREVTSIERPHVVCVQEAAVRLGLAPGVAPDAQGGLVAQDRVLWTMVPYGTSASAMACVICAVVL